MNSKTLSSWMLMAGPIVFFVVIIGVWGAVIGEGETAAENVANIIDKPTLASILVMIGSIAYVSIFVGYALTAWSRADGSTTAGTLASVASLIFVGIAAISMGFTGAHFGVIGGGEEDAVESAWVMAVIDNGLSSTFWFWALGNIILGAALFIEKKINNIGPLLLILWGVLIVLMHFTVEIEDFPRVIGMIIFMGMMVVTIVFGFFNLKSESVSTGKSEA
ncbi:MAG: hypothetical protein CL698_09855 [Chloroflexi bacterium]|nr:hypothetical protein [Chloroflexota bacterium]